MLGLELDVT